MKNINKINQSKQTSYCHSRLDRESMVESAWKVEDNHNGSCRRVNRFRTKSGMTDQSGRSMVEMLGVLAIIGVLSVGGIAGYTTAMNKHRANEILNAASVRAMMITTQLAQGRKSAELSLAEFGSEKVQGVSFDKEYTDGAETFNLKLTWDAANPSVCTQIKNIVGENVTVVGDCSTFTYKNEFGTTDPAPSGPSCPVGTSTEGVGGYATTEGTGSEAIRCYCETENTAWNSTDSDCSNATKANTCESFHDCNKGQYCRFSPSGCGDSARGTGTCTTLSDLETKTNGTQTLYLGPTMDWWSAGDFCAAHDKTLVSYATLLNAPYNCSKGSHSCTWSVFNGMGLSGYYWTGEDYGDSCNAWCVGVANDIFSDDNSRNSDYYYVLCE